MLQNRHYLGYVSYCETEYNGTLGQGKDSAIPLPARYPPGEAPPYACAYVDRSGDPVLVPGKVQSSDRPRPPAADDSRDPADFRRKPGDGPPKPADGPRSPAAHPRTPAEDLRIPGEDPVGFDEGPARRAVAQLIDALPHEARHACRRTGIRSLMGRRNSFGQGQQHHAQRRHAQASDQQPPTAPPPVKKARRQVQSLLGAEHDSEIIFTSCGTESNSTALLSALEAQPDRKEIITSVVEHPAILTTCRSLQRRGVGSAAFERVDQAGRQGLHCAGG